MLRSFHFSRCAAALAAGLLLSLASVAATVPIITYDVDQTPVSGFGCWQHTYTGSIVDTERTVSGSVICGGDGIGHVLNYSGGDGTLNDGLLDHAHLLLTRNDDAGVPLAPVIRLRFDDSYKINQIRLLATGFTNISGVTVEIDGMAVPFTPTPINGDPLNIAITLQGDLAKLPARAVTLKDFSATFFGSPIDQFGISEIEVVGEPAIATPTVKDQCKLNSWRTYGFRNQGQCVRYVEDYLHDQRN